MAKPTDHPSAVAMNPWSNNTQTLVISTSMYQLVALTAPLLGVQSLKSFPEGQLLS